ncbi:type II toxin-antitoxin system HipA family toxin [Agromyces mediolanus]|uniref:Kinase n=1 Tax=Agromyces mediolanus TaxID=41986 RepID=A0A918FG24_AGRME|nr:HipA domain-containing protein [Agromyces mediolanus]GGR35621.1 kinase [Agromyces mediolanus]GLJ73033.1 kinase [Agromyces mediolanus]
MRDDARHAVMLAGQEVGVLHQRGDFVRFSFLPEYWEDPGRNILGLWFEDHKRSNVASALRLPAWFANLLPEGRLRELIARDRRVSPAREMELLAQVGHDLPGAVQIVDGKGADIAWQGGLPVDNVAGVILPSGPIKFSLAGVGLKFSMARQGDRFTIPAHGAGGHWIVKLPHPVHRSVPENEFATMAWAAASGLEVPEIHLLHRDDAFEISMGMWPSNEEFAYAIKRFDRRDDGTPLHIEDFAQVRGFAADRKYDGAYETIGALCFRGHDTASLEEFVRRMVFNIVSGNGDAHLKNWSLLYPDGRNPRLSPAYDLVSTAAYSKEENLGLRFGRSRRFEDVSLWGFERLERRIRVQPGLLVELARVAFLDARDAWSESFFGSNVKFVEDWTAGSIDRLSRVFGVA